MKYVVDFVGYNVSKKRHAKGVIGNKHRVTREEAMKWFQQKVSAVCTSLQCSYYVV